MIASHAGSWPEDCTRGARTLHIDDLRNHLSHRNGNELYEFELAGQRLVLKVYFGSRSWTSCALKTLGNWLSADQTSVMPRHRRNKELECLDLWRRSGFRVFDTIDLKIGGLPGDGYTVFRHVEGPRFVEYFGDTAVPLPERLETWRRFLPVWHARHALAARTADPRLVHENGDLKHVMMIGLDFLFFDFETVFRSARRTRLVVGREILCYLKSMGRTVGPREFDAFFAETMASYPDRELLVSACEFAFRDPNPIRRFGRALERLVRERAVKPFSKYEIAYRIREELLHG